jgi:hypothetical protein
LKAASLDPVMKSRVLSSSLGLTFTLAVFLSAALLFVVEPMFGKMVLPLLGGSPAVWTTCMLFFQGALLLGYLYAHAGPRWFGLRWHAFLHIVLLAVCALLLPLGISGTLSAFRLEHPTQWLLGVLTLSIGAPFTLLSSTGPLLQIWFSNTVHPEAGDPYFLYAASNAGSLIGLLSYPFLIEPRVTLHEQSTWWTLGYLALLTLVATSALFLRTAPLPARHSQEPRSSSRPIQARSRFRWIALAFVPSSFLLAVTTYLSTDVAAVPLLWVLPLVLYLLSFVLVFGRRKFLSQSGLLRWQPVGLIILVVLLWWGPSASVPVFLPLHLLVFFVTALVCHGELAATRPPTPQLSEFYLCIAVGGVLGGLFNAVVAPAMFNSVLEYPLTLLLACAVRPTAWHSLSRKSLYGDGMVILAGCGILIAIRETMSNYPSKAPILFASGLAAIMCLRMSRQPLQFSLAVAGVLATGAFTKDPYGKSLLKHRNFFGVREVRDDIPHHMRVLTHGTTKHGAQSTDPARKREPTSYYYRGGPIGDVFRAFPSTPGRRVAVIGLGTGGLSAYAGPGEHWTFYEIDPDIARLARDTRYFTYLHDTPADVDIDLGDGRLSLAKANDHLYDIIILDAFSSDAIPLHLLTEQAMLVYLSKLSPNGVLVFHLSNRYLDLEPVVGRLAQAAQVAALIRANTGISPRESECGADPSVWAALAPDPASLKGLGHDSRWRPLRIRSDVGLWTDDFSNIVKVFRLPHKVPKKGSGMDSSGRAPLKGSLHCDDEITRAHTNVPVPSVP